MDSKSINTKGLKEAIEHLHKVAQTFSKTTEDKSPKEDADQRYDSIFK